jgi:uncharacterized protein YidB (DUF937 family)
MLENLLELVKQHAGEAVVNNPAIPNEHNDAVIQETTQSITGGLQNMLASGGMTDVLKMFGGQGSNLVTQNISGGVIQNLMNKFGLDQSAASGIASSLVPGILQNLVSQTNDPNNNNFNIQGIFNSLSGGRTQGFDVQALLSKVTQGGLDKDGDGDVDLQDLTAMFSGGGASHQQAGGGGILGNLKGLFAQ